MKKLFLLFLLNLIILQLFSQKNKIVVLQLKNGYSVRGEIIEQGANEKIKIQLADKTVIEYKKDEIDEVIVQKDKKSKSGLSITLSLGINSQNMNLSKADEKINVPGSYEVLMTKKLNDLFSIQTGLIFERKGSFTSESGEYFFNQIIYYTNENTQTFLDYIKLPMLFQIERGEKYKINLTAGPYIGLKIADKLTINSSSYTIPPTSYYYETQQIDNIYKKNQYDFGIIVGIGGELKLSNKISLVPQIRYNQGVIDQKFRFTDEKTISNSLVFNLGLKYQLKADQKTIK
jgi:hypothetical protein